MNPSPQALPGGLARDAFLLPEGQTPGSRAAYLCGHSLGPMPQAARLAVEQELARWARLGVQGHFDGEPGWIQVTRPLQAPLARLVGARPGEVVAMNALSVNLHLMLASFYRPRGERCRILLSPRPFASDREVARSHCRLQGLDPAACIVTPAASAEVSLTQTLVAAIRAEGERLSLACIEAIDYLSGEVVDLRAVAAAAHAVGACVGFDLAHAIGHVPLDLAGADADFAVWCSYKYLNAGPGALGGAFVHHRHHGAQTLRASGWWGIEEADRFAWDAQRQRAAADAGAWQLSNPPVLQAAALAGALGVFAPHAMADLHAHGQALLQAALRAVGELGGDRVEVLTPEAPQRHGQMLALRLRSASRHAALEPALAQAGAIVDVRGDIVRAAFCPLYNDLADVQAFVRALEACL